MMSGWIVGTAERLGRSPLSLVLNASGAARRNGSLLAGMVLALGVFAPGAALAQEYPLVTGELQTTNEGGGSLAAGDAVGIVGTGFEPGTEIRITIESDPVLLDVMSADESGAIDAQVTIPSGLTSGTHTLKATGRGPRGEILVLSKSVTIAGGAEEGFGPTLPFTGGAGLPAAAIAGLVALLVGTILLRRSRSQA